MTSINITWLLSYMEFKTTEIPLLSKDIPRPIGTIGSQKEEIQSVNVRRYQGAQI